MFYVRWSGNGIFTPFIVGIGVIAVLLASRELYGPFYDKSHPGVIGLGGVLGGFICLWVGNSLNKSKSRTLIDEQTQRRVTLRRTHTLYGIPMEWWGGAAMLGGFFYMLTHATLPTQFDHLAVASSRRANLAAPGAMNAVAAQQMAVRLYPALGVLGSDFNTRFLSLRKRYLVERPAYFQDPNWPVTLAREVAAGSH